MTDLLDVLDFLVDLVCMMPPLDIEAAGIPENLLMAACLGSVALLVVSMTAGAAGDRFVGRGFSAVVFAICVAAIGFISMNQAELRGLYAVGYPAMVISIRFAEGMILGSKYEPAARFWHLGAFICTGVMLYIGLLQLPTPSLSIVKGTWALIGAIIASKGWTTSVSQPTDSPFGKPLSKMALFLVFISTMLYVQSSDVDRLLFRWVFPVGGAIGIVAGRKDRHRSA